MQNRCLLSKWLFKLLNEKGLWQDIPRKKYLQNKTLSQVEKKRGDSQFWNGLMEVKDHFLARGRFVVHSGHQVSFWEDLWIGDKPFKLMFPSLYSLVRNKGATVAHVLSTSPLNVTFRRALVGDNTDKWLRLVGSILQVQLDDQNDCFSWSLSNKTFYVQSMYKDIMSSERVPQQCITWKVKFPLKIKIFLWYLNKGVILTKDNLVKRQWKGNTSCSFCDTNETIQHQFFDCHMARMVWNAVSITFGFPPPTNTNSLFGSWLKNFHFRLRNQILIRAAAIS